MHACMPTKLFSELRNFYRENKVYKSNLKHSKKNNKIHYLYWDHSPNLLNNVKKNTHKFMINFVIYTLHVDDKFSNKSFYMVF